MKKNHILNISRLASIVLLITACSHKPVDEKAALALAQNNADNLLIVDCLLPGRIRKLGQSFTYLTPRRPIKTAAIDCEIRGGEYVAYDRASYAAALKIWLPKAKGGNPEAQNYVGEIYEKGLGVQPDYLLASKWYQKAANQGDSRAQINLGYLYEKGLLGDTDLVTALNWYRKASGLVDDDLAFASTIETVRAEYEQQISLLENDLARSKNELEAQRKALQQSQSQLAGGRQKLNRARKELEKTRKQLETMERSPNTPDQQRDLEVYRQNIILKEAKLSETYQEVQRLENTLKTQNTDYNSKLKIAEKRTNQLNQELARHQKENVKLKTQLAANQDQLEQTESKLTNLNRDYKAEKERVSKERRELEQLKKSETKETERTLIELENDLALRENLLQEQRLNIAQLEKAKSEYEQKLIQLQTTRKANEVLAKPSIEIIDPPFVVTRGIPTVRLRSITKQREIVGKVTAPGGLLSLNVNDQQTEANDTGIFKSLIGLKSKSTPVTITAVDKIGNMSELQFILLAVDPVIKQEIQPPTQSSKPINIDFGTDHALIIGNKDYTRLPALQTPINDAKTIEKILREDYGFKTTLLINADRYSILSSLNKLREKLTEKDNLLLFYAGHGELDRVNTRGHWLPIDAEPDNSANWISTIAITDILNAMSAMHILVIADSCYSGAMTRSSLARLESGMSDELKTKWYKIMAKTRSRTVLTSGSLEPVLDNGANGHSIFANALIGTLTKNDGILEGQALYREVSGKVKQAALEMDFNQEPLYAPIRFGGHESGDFFLVRR